MLQRKLPYFLKACRSLLRATPSRAFAQVVLMDLYRGKVNDGLLHYDENQYHLIKLLSRVNKTLTDNRLRQIEDELSATKETVVGGSPPAVDGKASSEINNAGHPAVPERLRIRGLYFYGDVGTGKTMCMDLFFNSCDISKKRRVHFHKFMLEVHQRIHARKKTLLEQYGREFHINLLSSRDAIGLVANDIADECSVLCFDEFQVTDICDAMILTNFFGVLWERGTVLIATSNRPPEDLYKDGLNRDYFVPFIDQLKRECVVRDIYSKKDYRQNAVFLDGSYYYPLSELTSGKLWSAFVGNKEAVTSHVVIPVMMNRTVQVTVVDHAPDNRRACWTTFQYLCEGDRGASDYHALCTHFDIIYLDGIPQLSVIEHDKARRFITLIDEVYDAGVRLHWTATSPPELLFRTLTPSDIECEVDAVGGKNIFGVDHSWKGPPKQQVTPPPTNLSHPNEALLRGASMPKVTHTFTGGSELDAAQEELEMLEGELSSVQELRFAFKRAASRLTEMAGKEYQDTWAVRRARKKLDTEDK